jgi:hypothetical protein
MRRTSNILLLSLLLFAATGRPASALPHQLYLDFDTDGDLWTINPYAANVPVSLVIEIGDDPIPAGSDVFLMFDLGCYFDPQGMENHNCAQIDCDSDWGTPGILQDCWVDCPPLADCWDALLMARIDPAFAPVPGERYRIGTCQIYGSGGAPCEGASYCAFGNFAGAEVISNSIWFNATCSVSEEKLPTWGSIKALFSHAR